MQRPLGLVLAITGSTVKPLTLITRHNLKNVHSISLLDYCEFGRCINHNLIKQILIFQAK